MHCVTHRYHQMQKHKFGITILGVLFMEPALGPLEHEKYCVDVSRPGHTGMHYVSRRSHRMQKHKFGITCPNVIFVESISVLPEDEK
jgi:hypothetical protein